MSVATPTMRDKLKEVETKISDLRDERKDAEKERDDAREAYAGLSDLKPGSPEFEAAQSAVAKVGEIDEQIGAWQAEQLGILKDLGQATAQPQRDKAGNAQSVSSDKWSASALLNDDVMAMLEKAANSKGRFGGMDIGQVIDRDTLAADIAPTANMRRGADYGILPQLRRALTVLDLLPTGTMDNNTFPYTVESGSYAAAETTEGLTKPEDGVTYTDATATAQTIAAWMKIKKQALADASALRSIIDSRLRYSVLRRLEAQVLNGNGVDPNLRGIRQTTGIGTVAFDGTKLTADQILAGITNVMLADGQADGIVMHPTDWAAVLSAKAAGDGHYYSGGPFSMTPQTIWGIPLLASQAIPVGRALVGDFAIGAQLFIREGVNVLFSDSDQSDFIQNRVTLLGEMRGALAVWRPPVFVDVQTAV